MHKLVASSFLELPDYGDLCTRLTGIPKHDTVKHRNYDQKTPNNVCYNDVNHLRGGKMESYDTSILKTNMFLSQLLIESLLVNEIYTLS